MRTLSAVFLLYVLHNSTICYAVGEQVPSGCEAEASSPKSIYLNLVRMGFAAQAFTIDDVLWASEQKNPVSPFRSTRSPENLEIKRSLLRSLSLIAPEEWPLLVVELQKFLKAHARQNQVVDAAKVVTAPIYALKPLGIFAQQSSATGAAGNLGVYASVENAQTYVQRLRDSKKVPLEGHTNPADAVTFFQTTDGRILYASIVVSNLRVSDTATGNSLLLFDLGEIDRYADINYSDRKFRPILFERDGRLMVAAVLDVAGILPDIGRTKPAFLIDVESRAVLERKVPNQHMQYAQFDQNRLFAYGEDSAGNLIVHDLVANKNIFRTTYKLDDEEFDIAKTGLQLSFDEKGLPRLTILGKYLTSLNSIAEANLQNIENVQEAAHSFAFHIESYSDDEGRLWIAKLAQEFEDRTRTEFTLIRSLEKSWTIDLSSVDDSNSVEKPIFLKTRDGLKIFMWERNEILGVVVGIHVVDVQSQMALRLLIPPELNIIKTGHISYDREHNTINAFVRNEAGSWQLYQIFGPEDFGVRE